MHSFEVPYSWTLVMVSSMLWWQRPCWEYDWLDKYSSGSANISTSMQSICRVLVPSKYSRSRLHVFWRIARFKERRLGFRSLIYWMLSNSVWLAWQRPRLSSLIDLAPHAMIPIVHSISMWWWLRGYWTCSSLLTPPVYHHLCFCQDSECCALYTRWRGLTRLHRLLLFA